MLVQIRDRKALATLPIVNLRSYLTSRGWENAGRWGERPATIYTIEQAGRSWEVLLPIRDTIADYAESVAEIVAVLSNVEERSQLDVFYEISAVGADEIHLRSVNGRADVPLSLRQRAGLLNDAFDMLASAARAAERTQPAYRGKLSSDVTEYLDNVKPLPSYESGYSLTIHSPVPARIDGHRYMFEDYYVPFSRRATTTLDQALNHISPAIEEATINADLKLFTEAVEFGVSANLCNALAELAKKGHGIDIGLYWAGLRPSDVPNSHFRYSANAADILEEASKLLRTSRPSFDEQVLAQVVGMDRDPRQFDGKATIACVRDGRPVRIRVVFDEQDFDRVIGAFRDHASISLDGDIYSVGRGYELRNPRNLSVLA